MLKSLAVVLFTAMAAKAGAGECAFEPLEREKVVAGIGAAKSCEAAFALMNDCRTNTSGDVEFADAVIAKCEPAFTAALDAKQKAAYDKERDACSTKYSGEHGTMYVSFAATCEAGVAVRYATKHGR